MNINSDFKDTINPMCSCGFEPETTDCYLLHCKRLVIDPMSGNNATLKIDFTDPRKRNFVRNLFYILDAGSEMIHLPE